MHIVEIISFIAFIFYCLIGISFVSLCFLMFCRSYEHYYEKNNLNIMSDTYQGNNKIFTRSRKRANSK